MQKNSVNRVILVGHLGANPEARYTKAGRPVVSISVATNEVWKQQNGESSEHTEWHSVVAWDKLADFSKEFLEKGQLVSVEGRLNTRSWTSKEGSQMKTTEVIASSVTPLGTKRNA